MSDPEIDAMSAVLDALDGLDEKSRNRVLRWATARYTNDKPNTSTNNEIELEKPNNSTDGTTGEQIVEKTPEYDSFAEFYSKASPQSDRDRALVAAYWIQVHEKHDNWHSRLLNPILKDLGYPVHNITRALNNCIHRTPQLVLQLKKNGTSRQSNKIYKITQEGQEYVRKMLHSKN